MTRTSLLPGFRFHPTDVELIMYYLKRKVLGKKLHAEAIAEVNIYKFSPWDLPDRSCLKSNDLEWFFFCPRERKYASGARMKRSTENGYWKTTGKDRSVSYNEITVGHVKTLIFHLGHAPRGERTDWVIHEYRIQNDQVPAVGVQDTYVLCKVFKKNGLGPKNGAQYGAPFKEEEWTDDDKTDVNNATFFTLDVPSPPGLLSENQCSAMASLFDPGSTSELSLVKEGPSPSTEPLTDKVHLHFSDDEMDRLLAPYVDDSMLLLNGNGTQKDDFHGERGNTFVPFLDGNNICCGLQELNSCVLMDEARIDFAETVRDDYSLNNMLLQDNSGYIELNDFLVPLNHHSETVVNNQLCDIFGTYSHEDVPYLCSSGGFPIVDQYTSCESQLDVLLANGSNMGDNSLAAFQMGSGAVHDLEFAEIQAENRENVGPSFQLGQGKS